MHPLRLVKALTSPLSTAFPVLRAALGVLSLAATGSVHADLSWPGCDPLRPADFRMARLVGKGTESSAAVVDPTLDEPVKLAFDMDPSGAGAGRKLPGVRVDGLQVDIDAVGEHALELTDLAGLVLFSRNASDSRRYAFPASGREGMRLLRIRTAAGQSAQPVYIP